MGINFCIDGAPEYYGDGWIFSADFYQRKGETPVRLFGNFVIVMGTIRAADFYAESDVTAKSVHPRPIFPEPNLSVRLTSAGRKNIEVQANGLVRGSVTK